MRHTVAPWIAQLRHGRPEEVCAEHFTPLSLGAMEGSGADGSVDGFSSG
jgi:hypothetical protein